jgi:hypothetical protein
MTVKELRDAMEGMDDDALVHLTTYGLCDAMEAAFEADLMGPIPSAGAELDHVSNVNGTFYIHVNVEVEEDRPIVDFDADEVG